MPSQMLSDKHSVCLELTPLSKVESVWTSAVSLFKGQVENRMLDHNCLAFIFRMAACDFGQETLVYPPYFTLPSTYVDSDVTVGLHAYRKFLYPLIERLYFQPHYSMSHWVLGRS
jgi:hypothetical protein